MRLSDFIEKSNAAPTPEDVFEQFRAAVSDYGYNSIAFAAVTPAARLVLSGPNPAIAVRCPDDWTQHYFASRYLEIDPVILLAPGRRVPFLWTDLLAGECLSPRQKQIFRESEEAGLRNGLSIPLHGPNGEGYVVSLATDTVACDDKAHLARLQVLATQFYLAYSQVAWGYREPLPKFYLTERERECLTWTAHGKSAWATSMILGISEHTVNFHLKSAMRKLGVINKITAVVVAIRSGLITL